MDDAVSNSAIGIGTEFPAFIHMSSTVSKAHESKFSGWGNSGAAEKPWVGRFVSKCSVSALGAKSASRNRERQLRLEMRLPEGKVKDNSLG